MAMAGFFRRATRLLPKLTPSSTQPLPAGTTSAPDAARRATLSWTDDSFCATITMSVPAG
jgi:hypothetical protein